MVKIYYHVKYLGVWINASLKDDDDIRDKRNYCTVQQTNSKALIVLQ